MIKLDSSARCLVVTPLSLTVPDIELEARVLGKILEKRTFTEVWRSLATDVQTKQIHFTLTKWVLRNKVL